MGQLLTLSEPSAKWRNAVRGLKLWVWMARMHISALWSMWHPFRCWRSFTLGSESLANLRTLRHHAFISLEPCPLPQFQNITPGENQNHTSFLKIKLIPTPQPQNYWELENFIKRECVPSRTTSSLQEVSRGRTASGMEKMEIWPESLIMVCPVRPPFLVSSSVC